MSQPLAIHGGRPAVPAAAHVRWPVLGPEERQAVAGVLDRGVLSGQFAPEVRGLEREFAALLGSRYCIATNSGTSALHLALVGAGIGAGDEVIVPAFEAGLQRNDERISPAMKYLYLACKLGVPHVNFTPSLTKVPALETLAVNAGIPIAGEDGKTGQTLLKTALAPAFQLRHLQVEGWFSTNILGNNDGKVLDDPKSNKTKVASKLSVLDEILGYEVSDHQVHINYYRPRGDEKEAWDNIDLQGFLGERMQVKINFLCKDSILAAPLVLDLVRLMDVAQRNGERGIQRQFSLFFKAPYHREGERAVNDLFKQNALLQEWVEKVARRVRAAV